MHENLRKLNLSVTGQNPDLNGRNAIQLLNTTGAPTSIFQNILIFSSFHAVSNILKFAINNVKLFVYF